MAPELEPADDDQRVDDQLRRSVPVFRQAGELVPTAGLDLADVRRRSQHQHRLRVAAVAVAALLLIAAGSLSLAQTRARDTGLQVVGPSPSPTPLDTPAPTGTVAGDHGGGEPAGTSTTATTEAVASSTVPHLMTTTASRPPSSPSVPASTAPTVAPTSSTSSTVYGPTPRRVLRGDGVGDARFGEDIATAGPKLTALLGPSETMKLVTGQSIVVFGTFFVVFKSVDDHLIMVGWQVGPGDGDNPNVQNDHGVTMGTTLAAFLEAEPNATQTSGRNPQLDTYSLPDHGGAILADFYANPAHPDLAFLYAGSVPFDMP